MELTTCGPSPQPLPALGSRHPKPPLSHPPAQPKLLQNWEIGSSSQLSDSSPSVQRLQLREKWLRIRKSTGPHARDRGCGRKTTRGLLEQNDVSILRV